MRNGNHRLNPILPALINQLIVKPKPCLVWLAFIPIWKNPRPGNGKPVHLKSHFRKQGNILPKAVVMVNGFMGRIKGPLLDLRRNAFAPVRRTARTDVGNRHTLAAFLPAAFKLICRRGPSPVKILWKTHDFILLLFSLSKVNPVTLLS